MKITSLTLLALAAFTLSLPAATLRSFGAKGDSTTDDRDALMAALKQSAGQPLDGEGLTYAVHGSVSATVPVDLRNLTLKQTAESFDTSPFIRSTQATEPPEVTPKEALTRMVNGVPLLRYDGVAVYRDDPPVTGLEREKLRTMLNIRTLFISGAGDKPVSVKLENVKILRGDHPDAGMHSNAAGLYLVNASPLVLTNVEITGDGKGAGLQINNCRPVRIDRLHIHDIRWAPFRGDAQFTGEVLGRDFGWNNSPIYDFDDREGHFIRVRIQEQLAGVVLSYSDDIEITNSRVERIGTMIDGKFLPWQADGFTISGVKNLVMRDCVISEVWEGIDFTGKGVDGFLQENIRIADCFSYSFKYAHPQKNGKVINCVSERAGYKGFTIGAECENIEFTNCISRETGQRGYWRREGRPRNGFAGFEVHFEDGHSPRNITLQDCRAEDGESPTMEFGFLTSDRARNPALNIRLINPKVAGATIKPIDGFPTP
jgi:hypothetical protein